VRSSIPQAEMINPGSFRPMEAQSVDAIPAGRGWLYEPKYDGFRCLAYRDGQKVELRSKNQKLLNRYFPEVETTLIGLPQRRFILDGEILIPSADFETLQLRLHPAATRIEKLAGQYPASFIAFDLLSAGGRQLTEQPFADRRKSLETFVRGLAKAPGIVLSKATRSVATAKKWLAGKSGIEDIMAKRLDLPYGPGERAMVKFKLWKTVDCVVGGLYVNEATGGVDSLLLGLYDDQGQLNYVGRSRVYLRARSMADALRPLIGGKGFTGRAPGGKSRWSGKERKAMPLKPKLVVEVSADHITGDYMRHGSRILRWRDDKAPESCTMDQIRPATDRDN